MKKNKANITIKNINFTIPADLKIKYDEYCKAHNLTQKRLFIKLCADAGIFDENDLIPDINNSNKHIKNNSKTMIHIIISKKYINLLDEFCNITGYKRDQAIEILIHDFIYKNNQKQSIDNISKESVAPLSYFINTTDIDRIFGDNIKKIVESHLKPCFRVKQKKKYFKRDILKNTTIIAAIELLGYTYKDIIRKLNIPKSNYPPDEMIETSMLPDYMQISYNKVYKLKSQGFIPKPVNGMVRRRDIDNLLKKIIRQEIEV